MPDWIIFAAPLVIAALALSLAFAGCGLSEVGTGYGYAGEVMGESSLASYWRLGEAPGPTAADHKDGNAGHYHPTVTSVPGPGLLNSNANTENDAAAQFDGTSGYVSVPFTAALNPPKFTVEVLVRIAGGAGTVRSIVGSDQNDAKTGNRLGYYLHVNAANEWEGCVGDGTTKGGKTVKVPGATVSGTPHYVALTYDGSTLTLLVDPINDPANKSPAQFNSKPASLKPNTSNELRIGAGDAGGPATLFFNGVLDEVAIYSAALPYDTARSHFGVMMTSSKFA